MQCLSNLDAASMNNHRISIGFALRKALHGSTVLRKENRLDPENPDPLSADPSIWPTAEEVLDPLQRIAPGLVNPLSLVSSFEPLKAACERTEDQNSEREAVCITADPSITIELDRHFGPGYFSEFTPEHDLLSMGWLFQGFDIVNPIGMISGLKGCGYTEPTWSKLREAYVQETNERGLFRDTTQHFDLHR